MGLLLLCLGSAVAQKPYDLLLKGGHLIDPKNEINAPRDVAIAKGKIVAVGEDLDTEKAEGSPGCELANSAVHQWLRSAHISESRAAK